MYQSVIRPLLFRLDAERAHHLGLRALKLADMAGITVPMRSWCRVVDPRLEVSIGSLKMKNPIGLAAGLDKDGVALPGFAALGFGAIEVGTVTAEAQSGNPLPRVFRLERDQALINRMGFPSRGAEVLAAQLGSVLPLQDQVRVGINIGKTKRIDIEQATDDYLRSFRMLREYGDYFVLNVSSPNTPELRRLQEPERLKALLTAIRAAGLDGRPLLVKIAPDLDLAQLEEIVDAVVAGGATGIIATNTTFSREGLVTVTGEAGGLSGAPLFERAKYFVSSIYARTRGEVPVIGVGGIFNASQVWEMMEAGASAVQLYTGFIYGGPFLVRQMLRELSEQLSREGLPSINAIIGRKNGAFTRSVSAVR